MTISLDEVKEKWLQNQDARRAYEESALEYLAERSAIRNVSPEHMALIDSGAEQSPEDIEMVRRMAPVQWRTITDTGSRDNETLT